MEVPKIFESEYRLCLIVWNNEPLKSCELVRLCKEQIGWMPTTTFTVLKRLSERGVLVNEHTIVRSLISKQEVQKAELNEMVEKTFEGSVPAFIAAFASRERMTEKEVAELQDMIQRYQKEAKPEEAAGEKKTGASGSRKEGSAGLTEKERNEMILRKCMEIQNLLSEK